MVGTGSSSTSSRTSRRSSTSEAPGAPRPGEGSLAGQVAGWVRLTHPFPSLLDGIATAAIAALASGDVPTVVRLGVSMTALQASIGILNDVVDAPRDAGRKPSKPIPAGLVEPGRARAGVVVAAGLGLALAAPSGRAVVALGAAILAIGYAYDLRLKGTPWSWAPFALGIPLLPVFAWLGVAGSLPPFMGRLVAAAVLAGAVLAISNARADLERDRAAGVASVATALGSERSWWLALGLVVAILAVAAGPVLDAVAAGSPPAAALIGVLAGPVLLLAGVIVGYRAGPGRRERAWELQAVGIAVLAVGWLGVVTAQP
jgi:4-hydroxybenzoate polyprenyltransferase